MCNVFFRSVIILTSDQFHNKVCIPVRISIGGVIFTLDKKIDVLGVKYNSKLQCVPHIFAELAKANQSLNDIKLIRHYLYTKDLIQLLTSNICSFLYYNSELWFIS